MTRAMPYLGPERVMAGQAPDGIVVQCYDASTGECLLHEVANDREAIDAAHRSVIRLIASGKRCAVRLYLGTTGEAVKDWP